MGPRNNNDEGINAIDKDSETAVARNGKLTMYYVEVHVSFMNGCFILLLLNVLSTLALRGLEKFKMNNFSRILILHTSSVDASKLLIFNSEYNLLRILVYGLCCHLVTLCLLVPKLKMHDIIGCDDDNPIIPIVLLGYKFI